MNRRVGGARRAGQRAAIATPASPQLLSFDILSTAPISAAVGNPTYTPVIGNEVFVAAATVERRTITYEWSSSNTGVFTVNSTTGECTWVGAGTAFLRCVATGEGIFRQQVLQVTVSAGLVPTTVVLNRTSVAAVIGGAGAVVTAEVRDQNGGVMQVTTSHMTWASSDVTKCTVTSPGLSTTVTGVATGGSPTVQATFNNGVDPAIQSAAIPVSVTSPPVYTELYRNDCSTVYTGALPPSALPWPEDPFIIGSGAGTMLGNQGSGPWTLQVVQPYNNPQNSTWPQRTPLVYDPGGGKGPGLRVDFDVSGTNGTGNGDQVRGVKMGGAAQTKLHIRVEYRMATQDPATAINKWFRFRYPNDQAGGTMTMHNRKWNWVNDGLNGGGQGNHFPPVPSAPLWDNDWHYLEFGQDCATNSSINHGRVWHLVGGNPVIDSQVNLTTPFTVGWNKVYLFNLYNAPCAELEIWIRNIVIATDYIGPP